jgi:hypothetical protein
MGYKDTVLARNPLSYWRLGEASGNAIDEMDVTTIPGGTPYGVKRAGQIRSYPNYGSHRMSTYYIVLWGRR